MEENQVLREQAARDRERIAELERQLKERGPRLRRRHRIPRNNAYKARNTKPWTPCWSGGRSLVPKSRAPARRMTTAPAMPKGCGRRSSVSRRESWPEEAWQRTGCLMTNAVLCIAGILEHLATGRGSRDNMETLTRRAFENALEAYWDAGCYDQDFTLPEDIPE